MCCATGREEVDTRENLRCGPSESSSRGERVQLVDFALEHAPHLAGREQGSETRAASNAVGGMEG